MQGHRFHERRGTYTCGLINSIEVGRKRAERTFTGCGGTLRCRVPSCMEARLCHVFVGSLGSNDERTGDFKGGASVAIILSG